MLRRTLTALTPALFALPFLLTPASQVYADADGMTSVYSGLECRHLDARWGVVVPPRPTDQHTHPDGTVHEHDEMPTEHLEIEHKGLLPTYAMEGQGMAGGDVLYHSRLGIGNTASAMNTPDGDYKLTVACPLPALQSADEVAVAVIDGTVFDDVTCRVQSCVAGLGRDQFGVGSAACAEGTARSTNSQRGVAPYTQREKYITQNVDWLTLHVVLPGYQPEEGLEVSEEPQRKDQHVSTLLCTLPEQDDISPEAPGLANQDRMDQGVSYIQLYRVESP